ncbi:MAG: dockerin type I repeat-containing protein [bacterium]
MTCYSLVQPQAGTSNSNRQDYAGGSCGGSDGSSGEFSHYVAPLWQTFDTFGDEFDLQQVPSVIGADGVSNYLALFDVPEYNEWWSDLGVWINVLEVTQPGILTIGCNQAAIPFVEVPILDPGEYLIPIGGIDPAAPMVELHFLTDLKASCSFEWDSWGVQSLVPIEFVWYCGDANGDAIVNITDAVYLIQYIFSGGAEPDPYESGDANCDSIVNITDAVYLISYIFSGGYPPCDTDGDGIPDC